MVSVVLSDVERASQKLSAENLEKAVRALDEDGFVVIEDVIDLAHIATVKERVLADVVLLQNRPNAPFNWNRGNVQQDPPPFPPYLFRDILVNEYAIQVTHAVLGNGMYCAFYSGNTAVQSDDRQPVHADSGQLWPVQKVAHPPYSLVVNVPLVDMSAENGSTEIWPGTHADTSVTMQDGDIKVTAERQAERAATHPPLQPNVKAGSILIRDMRMWHAGMPNRTANPRPMLAMIHSVGWFPGGRVRFQTGSEAFLQHDKLEWRVDYVDHVDHISAPGGFEFAESN
jgi:ectoine hydroxylase-related dioxygenase (phytanoyl-CoA dioxygenase family)